MKFALFTFLEEVEGVGGVGLHFYVWHLFHVVIIIYTTSL